MKLQTKTILYYLLISVPLLVVAVIISYFSIKRAVNENLNEEMWADKQRAEALIDRLTEPKDIYLSLDSLSTIKADTNGFAGHRYTNIIKMDGEQVECRALKSFYKSKGTSYLITIIKPKLEEDDLIESLLQTLLITIGFLVFSFLIVNWILSKTLWRPFNDTMKQLEGYDVNSDGVLKFKPTSTTEFKKLNKTVQKMTEKVKRDFLSQKEFTENASHESQTPLAVIKARLDLLLQSPNLKEGEMKQLEIIEQAVTKLSSLNKALLLLAKIENNQFKNFGKIDLDEVFSRTLHIYEDNIISKKIQVSKIVKGTSIINADPVLVDILISNLIQNAVRHNEEGGNIVIELYPHKFVIANTGKAPDIRTEKLFERFRKNGTTKESVGLGLAIVKSILQTYNYKFDYSYVDNRHLFVVEF